MVVILELQGCVGIGRCTQWYGCVDVSRRDKEVISLVVGSGGGPLVMYSGS